MELDKRRGGGLPMAEGSSRFDSSRALRLLEDVGTELTEDLVVLMPTLISFLRHADQLVVKKSVTYGTVLIADVLQEIAFQINSFGKVNRWLEELWSWMVQFKELVPGLLLESVSVGTKTAALKFLETCAVLFTPHPDTTGPPGNGFNIINIPRGYCRFLDPAILESDGIKALNLLLDGLHSSYTVRGAVTITSINCLVAVAKKRPAYYEHILSGLLNFDLSKNSAKGAHASIRYNLRAAYIGFLKSTNPFMVESRDKLIMALRGLSPGESTEQIIRQVEKMSRSMERSSRDNFRTSKDEHSQPAEDSINRKRGAAILVTEDLPAKRVRSDENLPSDQSENNSDLTPAGKMIAVIGALIAEGERGVGPLELLISNIHADLLADIVIETMQQLPKSFPVSSPHTQVTPVALMENLVSTGDGTEGKRDPRKDPRRLDPRRPAVSMGSPGSSHIQSQVITDTTSIDSRSVPSLPLLSTRQRPPLPFSEPDLTETASNLEIKVKPESKSSQAIKFTDVAEIMTKEGTERKTEVPSATAPPDLTFINQDAAEPAPDDHNSVESDRPFQAENKDSLMEDATASSGELPVFPLCLELCEREMREASQMAISRLIDGKSDSCLQLLARMVALNDPNDDILEQIQKHISVDFHRHKGHELAMHLLYHLKAVAAMDSSSAAALDRYEKFLTSLARALLDNLPSTDKSFSRLLGDAPFLPGSAFHLLEELCGMSDGGTQKEIDGGDRVTQGLGTVWSLILGRPSARMACLDIALKCAVHSQDEVRSKAIRLVVNKLYLLSYASTRIEEFATNKLLSVVCDQTLETEVDQTSFRDTKLEIMNQEMSVTSSQSSEVGLSENESGLVLARTSGPSLSQAQTQISLFFALCSKKPSLLRVVFDVYGKTPKAVKQAIHRHIPVLLRNLGSCSELLDIIYKLPEGSENLITLVLQVLTEESTPSAELIGAVKHLYYTKLKDPVILIPMLSSLSKEEVLPIFPRLLDLPLEKFHAALARILQGSAHTGPALTPTEVLIAIHDINPEKDRVALKKVTDACTACFEQRTVFTQQVLAKALNQMVEKVPLPLLFMRTVIQTIDAFPSLVDFVMSLLSKLVSKQIWKMPKLYAGFLKLVYQTQPHSFPVLLELPSTQLENVLAKHTNLRGPLASFVINKNIHSTVPSQTLKVLGLLNEPQQTAGRPFDSGASIQGTTLT